MSGQPPTRCPLPPKADVTFEDNGLLLPGCANRKRPPPVPVSLEHPQQFLSRYQTARRQANYTTISQPKRRGRLHRCFRLWCQHGHVRQLPDFTNSPRALRWVVRIRGPRPPVPRKAPRLDPLNGDSGLRPACSLLSPSGESESGPGFYGFPGFSCLPLSDFVTQPGRR